MDPLVSVIVPVYNAERFITQCLSSVENQSYTNIELVVVDDCSTDQSFQAITDFFNTHNLRHVVIENDENRGVSTSRNKGISASSGEYLFFLDSDDMLHTHCISEIIRQLESGKYDYVFCNMGRFVCDDEVSETPIDKMACTPFPYAEKADVLRVHGYPCGAGYKASIIKEMQITFPEGYSYMEDCVFNAQYLLYVNRIGIIDVPLYFYRKTGTSLSSGHGRDVITKKTLIACIAFNEAFMQNRNQYPGEYIEYRRYFRSCFWGELNGIGFASYKNYSEIDREAKGEISRAILRSDLKLIRKLVELCMQIRWVEKLIYHARFKLH